MSIEVVVPKSGGSFLYEGCYRPRGALTFAERSAWGLYSQTRARHAIGLRAMKSKSAIRHASICPPDRQRRDVNHVLNCRAHVSARRPRFGIVNLSTFAKQYARRRLNLQNAVHAKERWFVIRASVADITVTCLVARNRTFVAGFMQAKEKKR